MTEPRGFGDPEALWMQYLVFEDDICPNYKDHFHVFKINEQQWLAKFSSLLGRKLLTLLSHISFEYLVFDYSADT